MSSHAFLHAAEPWLASSSEGFPERPADRLAATLRLVEQARNEEAPWVLIAGPMLAPGRPEPNALHKAATSLAQAAQSSGVMVIATGEAVGNDQTQAAAGWHQLLGAGGWLKWLACRPAADAAPPVLELTRGLAVVGLGRPASETELAQRIERVPPAARGTELVALLSIRPGHEPSPALLDALLTRTSYVALGGASAPVDFAPAARDPGPLTRRGCDGPPADPGYLLVGVNRKKVAVRRLGAGDRPLSLLKLDGAAAASVPGLELQLTEKLRAVDPALRALIRIEVIGQPSFDPTTLDELRLQALARDIAHASAVEVVNKVSFQTLDGTITFDATTPRRELEDQALSRALGNGEPQERALAESVLQHLRTGDEAAALNALAHYLEECDDAHS